MPSVPLFTKSELQAAFALILPARAATKTVDEWWTIFADEVDVEGRFLADDERTPRSIRPTDGLVAGSQMRPADQLEAQNRLLWSGMTVEDRRSLLLRYSNFHMRLVGLVSEELFERMRLAEGLDREAAERGRSQMRGIVAAIQAGQS